MYCFFLFLPFSGQTDDSDSKVVVKPRLLAVLGLRRSKLMKVNIAWSNHRPDVLYKCTVLPCAISEANYIEYMSLHTEYLLLYIRNYGCRHRLPHIVKERRFDLSQRRPGPFVITCLYIAVAMYLEYDVGAES